MSDDGEPSATATFNKNGATSMGSASLSCYPTASVLGSCTVTTPTITSNTGYELARWSKTNGAATQIAVGSNITGLAANAIYYGNSKFTGTIYRWSTENWTINQNISNFTAGKDYVTNVSDATKMSYKAAKYYLKYTVKDNVVIESYVCFKLSSWQCLKGSSSYSEDVSFMQSFNSWFVNSGDNYDIASNGSRREIGPLDFQVEFSPYGSKSAWDYIDLKYCIVFPEASLCS